MSKLSHHKIQIRLDVEMEQLLQKLMETTGLNTADLFKKSLLSLQYLLQENTLEGICHKPVIEVLLNRESGSKSVSWAHELPASLSKKPNLETSGEISNVKAVLALLNSPLFKNTPPGNPEAIESVIETNRTAWDD